MQNRNIYPYLIKEKASKKDGTCPIYIFVDIDNKRAATFSTKKKVLHAHWDATKRCVKSNVPNAILINSAIGKKIKELEGELLKKEILNVRISKHEIRAQLKNKSKQSFADFCNKQIRKSTRTRKLFAPIPAR